ncbi:MAG: amidase [Chloroflexi bacterium]|nr:amidase [Chloroflexota bacterium]
MSQQPIESLIQPLSLVDDLDAMRRGLSPLVMVERLSARFAEVEDKIQAFVAEENRFDRLRRDAEALLDRHPQRAERPPLFGALLGIKDIFHAGGFTTRAGAALPPDLFAGEEAKIVTQLKQAGALVLGKTATTEFAYFEPGPTRNPHNPAHTPGGSSSGSAAAVAAGLAHLALGTQTVGSVIRPAAYCGIVGYKPSFDRVSTQGLVTFSKSADHVGFFCQNVADMQAVAEALVADWAGGEAPARLPVLGVPDGAYLQGSTALDAFEAQIRQLEKVGYPLRRISVLDDIESIDAYHQDMIAAELALGHEGWFAKHGHLYRPRTAALIRYGGTISLARLEQAREHRMIFRERIHAAMADDGVDLWLCPAAPDVAPAGIAATGDPKMNMPWTHAGLPALTLPAGLGKLGLPLGLQLVARFGADPALLHWARGIEALFR